MRRAAIARKEVVAANSAAASRPAISCAPLWLAAAAAALAGLLLLSPAARAEHLPGILNARTMSAVRHEALQQRRDARSMVTRRAAVLGYSRSDIRKALTPTMNHKGSFRVALKDGTEVEFPWFRIGFAENRIANTAKAAGAGVSAAPRGNAASAGRTTTRHETNKGGIRLHHGVLEEEVYALALKMDTKLAVARDALGGHSFRGAKGGIGAGRVVKVGSRFEAKVGDFVDPASPIFDRGEMMRKYAASFRGSGGDVGPGLDIQAGDVNTKAAEMKVLSETYGSARRPSAGVSGKAVMRRKDGSIDPKGGIEYRTVSTGDGVWMTARLAARRAGVKLRGATVAAQGWGEVGRAFGMAAVKDGARVIAIQEVWNVGGEKKVGTLLFPGSSPRPQQIKKWIGEVEALRASGQDLLIYQGGRFAQQFRAGMDASQVKADIVGVNALGSVLTDKTVPAYVASGTHQGRRKVIVEGANLAQTTRGAQLIDRHRDRLLVVSGDLANLGGVHVSNLEAVQNVFGEPVSSQAARRSLQGTIRSGWNRAMKIADTRGVSEREAVELAAVDSAMKRSLHLPRAPRASLERRVLSREKLAQHGSLLGELGTRASQPARAGK